MDWVITGQPSHIVKGSAARCADLPTQVPALVSVNVVSLTLPKLRPSPRDYLPQKRTALPRPITTASVRPVLLCHSMSSTIGAVQVWGSGGAAPLFLVKVMCIPRQYWVWGNQGIVTSQRPGWIMGGGTARCSCLFKAFSATW